MESGINWLVKLPPSVIFRAVIRIQRFWKKMRAVLKRFRRRGYIVKELYDTEKSYITSLEYLITQKKYLLKNAEFVEQPLLTTKEVTTLFSNVETLRDFNKKFFKEIEKRIMTWNHNQKIGDVFIRYAPFFRLYNEYFQNYERAEKIYQSAMKKPAFVEYTNELLKEPESKFLSLNSFLIMPVQRPVKYPLLLKDLLLHTKVTHVDFRDLKKAH